MNSLVKESAWGDTQGPPSPAAPATPVVPTYSNAGKLGLGLAGTGEVAKRLSGLMEIRDPSPSFFQNGARFAASRNVDPESFAYAYADAGHNLSKERVWHRGEQMPVGDAVNASKHDLALLVDRLPERLKTGLGIKPMLGWALGPGQHESSAEHYRNFAESPMKAYRQLVAELPEISMNNAQHQVLGKLPSGASVLRDDLPSQLAHTLSLNPSLRNEHVMNLPLGILRSNKVDFAPFFDDLSAQLGFERGKAVDIGAARHALDTKLFHEMGADTLVGQLNDRMEARKFTSLAEVANEPHALQRFANLLVAGRMRQAPRSYGRVWEAAKALNALGKGPVRAVGYGAATLAALPMLASKLQGNPMQKTASQPSDDNMPAAVLQSAGGAMLGSSAIDQIQQEGFRRLNPFGTIRGQVIGGPSTGSGSFGFQSRALASELGKHGLPTSWAPAFNVSRAEHPLAGSDPRYAGEHADVYSPRAHAERLGGQNNLDYVVQVGAHPEDEVLAQNLSRNTQRYRMLSDYGKGNFQQPSSWLGGRNWMKVHDDPGTYKRFFVPGASDIGVQGRSANVPTGNLAVSDLFGKVPFAQTKAPMTVVGMGGGSGAKLLFPDAYVPGAGGGGAFDPLKRNLLDDVVEATRRAHGPDAKVHVMLGGAKEFKEPFKFDFLDHLLKQKESGFSLDGVTPRWGNVEFHGLVPQERLAKDFYAQAHNIVHLPGSTLGELMSMPGEHLPHTVNMLPDEGLHWMPKHWSTNADAAATHLPGSSSLSLVSPDRASKLAEIFSKPTTVAAGRVPFTADMAPVASAIRNDVRLSRLGNLGRFGGKLAGSVALGGTAISSILDYFRAKRNPALTPMNASQQLKLAMIKSATPSFEGAGYGGAGYGGAGYGGAGYGGAGYGGAGYGGAEEAIEKGLARRSIPMKGKLGLALGLLGTAATVGTAKHFMNGSHQDSHAPEAPTNPDQGNYPSGSANSDRLRTAALIGALGPAAIGTLIGGVGGAMGGSPISGAITGLGTGAGFTAGAMGGRALSNAAGLQGTPGNLLTLGTGALGAYLGNRGTNALVGGKKKRDEDA